MTQILLDQATAFVRGKFTKQEVKDVRIYAGEFSAAEIQATSYNCPAILLTVLGWSPEPSGKRLSGKRVRAVSMAAFIAFKHVNRDARMAGAMNLAERLSLALSSWVPDDGDTPISIAPVDTDPVAENLYGRAVDKAGQALWMVRWTQDVRANLDPGQLFDLLAIDIVENDLPGQVPPPAPPGGVVPTVTDAINFQQLPQP
jgi:hypothetical protein